MFEVIKKTIDIKKIKFLITKSNQYFNNND